MAPAQVLIDLDQERKMEAPIKSVAEQENGNFLEIKDGMGLRCMNNCEDTTFDMDTVSDQHKVYEAGDAVVDILDCTDTSTRVIEDEDPDATEYSSSFGNTVSGSDNGLKSNLSDAEVESQFHHDNGASKKKKLTAHWRRYIRPLMWRCKWIELRVKEFQSQALKYDKELSAYSERKRYKLGQVASENSAARLLPLSYQNDRKQVMKRRKRKRLEDTVDLSTYMSHHSLFSYYENKKSEADGGSIDDDCGTQVIAVDQNANPIDEFGINYEWPMLESRDGDNSLEQILWNIEVLQSRVFKINTQINKLLSKNARKFSSMENSSLFMPSDLPTSSARSPFSAGNGDEMPVGALYTPLGHISEYEIGDLVIPDNAMSSFEESLTLPDIIESTLSLLTAGDVSLDRPQIGDSCTNVVEDVLIHNQAAEEELQDFEKVSEPINKPRDPAKEQEKDSAVSPVLAPEQCPSPELEPAPESILGAKPAIATEEPVLKSCVGSEPNVPKNKRKRAGRRGGFGRWNAKNVYSRRSSGGKDNRRV